ncbi:hypothetical protein K9O30_22525 [Clostridium bowmanii]|uniref:hypothetical protein n=1 Tax=Clostridium bowmanii TaxID=132925 RepID=UPI001C0D181E|nr:hypothetical protein [Clostridium bowmanii]MBU3192208.1 hypothetical protein [Clostridium bowmanii]MCA1076432.1 hypothetical protein [Clostridium bowmanii]
MNFELSMLWFWSAYVFVTLVGIGHTCFNWKVLKMENKVEKVSSMYDIVPYAKTVPFHALYNIIIWPIFSYIYFLQVNPLNIWKEALVLGTSWALITIIFDVFGWVIIKHPWRMTFKEMYVDYQPWITLIYISIFISPFIAVFFILN